MYMKISITIYSMLEQKKRTIPYMQQEAEFLTLYPLQMILVKQEKIFLKI